MNGGHSGHPAAVAAPSGLSVGAQIAWLLEGDFSRGVAAFAENVVWHIPGQGDLAGEHRGREAALALIGRWLSARCCRPPVSTSALAERDGYRIEWLEVESAAGGAGLGFPIVSRSAQGRIREVWVCSRQPWPEAWAAGDGAARAK